MVPLRSMHLLFASVALCAFAGCNRQDAERLSRIGNKVTAHAKTSSNDLGAKMDITWPKQEPTLQEKVQDRLRFDKSLQDVKFEVMVKDKEVELKGMVKDAAHKQRAIHLAETLVGVDKVVDHIHVQEPEQPKKDAGPQLIEPPMP